MTEYLTQTELARKVAEALRHSPEVLGLDLDQEGWVTFDNLLEGFESYTPHDLPGKDFIRESLVQNNRNRFEIEEERVRAIRGHTTQEVSYTEVELELPMVYIIVNSRHVPHILEYGIEPRGRARYTRVYETYSEVCKEVKKSRMRRPAILKVYIGEGSPLIYERAGLFYVEEVWPEYLEECTE